MTSIKHPHIQIYIQNPIRTPVSLYENGPIDTVVCPDYDGAIRFRHIQHFSVEQFPKWGVRGPL